MKITAKLFKCKKEGNMKAFGSITIEDAFAIRGVKVIEGQKGLFVSMPTQKNKKGEYEDVAFPVSKEAREEVTKVVLAAYEALGDAPAETDAPAPAADSDFSSDGAEDAPWAPAE